MHQLLEVYWDMAVMAVRESGYYRYHFQVSHGVTQGEELSPRIFNIFVLIFRHWAGLVVDN